MTTSPQLLKSLPLILSACALTALSSCSTVHSGKEHPLSKNIPSSLFQDSKFTLKAQPNGYACMESPFGEFVNRSYRSCVIKVYLDKNDLHQIQQILNNFRSWESIARSSGINAEKHVFHVKRDDSLYIIFHAQAGRAWIELRLREDYCSKNIKVTPSQINEAQRLIAQTLKEMDSLQQVEQNLNRLH